MLTTQKKTLSNIFFCYLYDNPILTDEHAAKFSFQSTQCFRSWLEASITHKDGNK